MRVIPLFCVLALAAPAIAAADKKPLVPIDSFVREDQFSNPNMSPDGKHIVLTVRVPEGDRFISTATVYSLPDLKIEGSIRMPVFQVPASYTWVSNTRMVITKAIELGSREQPRPTGEVLAMEFDGTRQEYLYGYNNFLQSRKGDRYGDDHGYAFVSDVPTERNNNVALNAHLWDAQRSILIQVNTLTAARKQLADLPLPYLSYSLENNGKPRFAGGANEETEFVLFRHDDSADSWNPVPRERVGSYFWPTAYSEDDRVAYALYAKNGEPESFIKEDLKTGARVTLLQDAFSSVRRFAYGSRRGAPPFAISTGAGMPHWVYLDEGSPDAQLHKVLLAQFPGNMVNFINFTEDGSKLLFSVTSDRDPGGYYLYDRKTNRAELLFLAMEKIEPEDMAERRPIRFKARDGLELDGFITLPNGMAGRKAPLVVMPHGGPHGPSDRWYFNTDAQFLASRGYAVLQVNYRGSGGRGDQFEHAGYRQWGGKIMDDLIDGVKWAGAQGLADEKRVCSYGASFGGYAALMLTIREPGMFKCAVGYAGIYDLNLFYEEDRAKRDKQRRNFYVNFIGTDKQELNQISPARQADKITVPVFLVHGGKDKTAEPKHAEAMREALIKVNRPPEWMFVDYEGHGFYDTKNVTALYEKLEAFLSKHIGK